jgi:hypothetical protein
MLAAAQFMPQSVEKKTVKRPCFYLGTRYKTLPLVIHGYLPFLFKHQQLAGIQGTYEEMQVDTQAAYRAS